ncbi:MAG: hypothetical protein ACLRFL_02145 [Clostridia bacterium]
MNHTLVDMFYNKEADKLSNAFDKSIQDNKKYTEEIKDLLPNEKKELIDHYSYGILNSFDINLFNCFNDAIHFGIQIGMEIQRILDEQEFD